MTRSWVFLSVLQLSPIWYAELGFDRAFYGTLATVIIVAGAVGTLFGGNFADRFGQRRIIASSLALTIPALLIYAAFPGPQALILGAIFGFLCDASISITLVMAQKLVPGRVGIASGVILGLGFVTGGIGVPITGRLADLFGMQLALSSLVIMLIAGTLLTFTLPATAAEARAEPHPDREPLVANNDRSAASGARR
jgi:FSR family fosmidomycin resistance protein-like MFS transporter